MVGFFSEIEKKLGTDFSVAAGGYRYVMFGDYACYLEGSLTVASYNGEEISLRTKKALLTVTGVDLVIRSLDGGSVLVEGKFLSVQRTVTQA